MAAFLRALAPHAPQRFALEFRDANWLRAEVFALLESAGVALCLPISPAVPLDVRLTAPWTYIRFHGGRQGIGFGDEELQLWAERIRGFREAHGAERLRAMLT